MLGRFGEAEKIKVRAMGKVIYRAFASRTKHTGGIRSPKQRTLLNADLLWRHKGWAYQPPSTNLPARWEKEIAGVLGLTRDKSVLKVNGITLLITMILTLLAQPAWTK